MGQGLNDLKKSHLALQAGDLIPDDIMMGVYGKNKERQVRHTVLAKSVKIGERASPCERLLFCRVIALSVCGRPRPKEQRGAPKIYAGCLKPLRVADS